MTSPSNNAENIIKAISLRYEADFKPASVQQWIKELEPFTKSELEAAFQRFKVEYESLPYRFSVAAGLIKQLKPALSTATVEERLYAALKDKDPWKFLGEINPKLKELADQGNMFDRSLSAADLEFRVKSIAKRFIEWSQNNQRGFTQKEPEPLLLEDKTGGKIRKPNPFKGLEFPKTKEEAEKFLKNGVKNANT